MRLALLAFLGSALAVPAMAGDVMAEKFYGRDPGNAAAYACFSKTFDEAWLKAHPDQNVARLTVFVARRSGEDSVWHSAEMEIHFRDSKATYQVSADCSGEGDSLGCGVDCDGGGYKMTAISKSEFGLELDERLRYYDITEPPVKGAKTIGFQPGDRNLTIQRTELRDCLPQVTDDDVRAKIAAGALTQ